MKLRKIISLALATMLATSAFSTVSFASSKAIVKETITKFSTDAGNRIMEVQGDISKNIPEGGAAYLVEFSLADVTLGRIDEDIFSTDDNNRISAIELYYNIENSSNIKMVAQVKKSAYYGITALAGTPWAANNASLFQVVSNVDPNGIWPTAEAEVKSYTEAAPTDTLLGFLFIVNDASVPVKFKAQGLTTVGGGNVATLIKTAGFEGPNAATAKDKEYRKDAGSLSINDFTLGTEAPAGTTVNVGTGVAVEAKEGKVWNDVVITNPSKGTDYVAKFTDNMGTVDVADDEVAEFPITGIEAIDEVNGDATFAVILKTTRTLANIALDILFQNAPAAE